MLAFFNLRQKVYTCTYAHIDVNKIYKSKKAGSYYFEFEWTKLNEWMSDVTKSSTSTEFSVLVLITFLLKIDIRGLAMLI